MSYGEAFTATLTVGALVVLAVVIVAFIGPTLVRNQSGEREIFAAVVGLPALFVAVSALIALIVWWLA